MTVADLRAALLAADDITVVPVPTPEWPAIDGQVYVRLLSAGGRWTYLRGVRPVIEAGEALAEDGMVRESGLRLAAATLCDATGALLFPDVTPDEMAALAAKAPKPVQRAIDASAALNGFDGKAVDDAKKNLAALAATSGSSTASPPT